MSHRGDRRASMELSTTIACAASRRHDREAWLLVSLLGPIGARMQLGQTPADAPCGDAARMRHPSSGCYARTGQRRQIRLIAPLPPAAPRLGCHALASFAPPPPLLPQGGRANLGGFVPITAVAVGREQHCMCATRHEVACICDDRPTPRSRLQTPQTTGDTTCRRSHEECWQGTQCERPSAPRHRRVPLNAPRCVARMP